MLKQISHACKQFWLPFVALLGFIFLYMPILVLIVFSFNDIAFPFTWAGFSMRWYSALFSSSELWPVLKNSLIVAMSATCLSLAMGILLVFYAGQSRLRSFFPMFYANLVFPEIVLSVGLLVFFTYWLIPLSMLTLIVGHTILGLGYVIPILSARFDELETSMIEASLDLGATLNQTFFKVIIPTLFPSMIAAGLLVFVISFDDFLIAFFCAGSTSQTLPLYIFSMIRSGVSPIINALSVMLILFSSLCVLIFCSLRSKIRMF